MLEADLSRASLKFLQSIPAKHARQLAGKIIALQADPAPPDSLQLKGKAQLWRRTDSGEYRIIYRTDGDILRVAAIGKRNDGRVYRDFERKL